MFHQKSWKYFFLDFKVQSHDTLRNLGNFKELLDHLNKGFLVKMSLKSFSRNTGEKYTKVFFTNEAYGLN